MGVPRIRQLRAYTVRGGGADYHDQAAGHWIDDHIATPMARYPEYRHSRQSFGLNALGTLVVEAEADDGSVGLGVTVGGEPGAWIVEQHLARLVEGQRVTDLEKIWDQMYLSTLHYGRKGLALNTVSGIDLALWDLLGQVRQEPVYQLLGGAVRDELVFYATGPRPDLAQKMGFIGGKLPLRHGPAEGEEGLRANLDALAAMRQRVGDDFWLMWDCWMSLDLDYATRLAHAADEYGLRWIEEPLLPDDYWGHADLRRRMPARMLLTAGEHEATRWGFRLLLETGQVDIVQPDVGWCGGITELRRIAALADSHGKAVVPHGSSVYSYHFVVSRPNSPFAEFLMMHPEATEVVPMLHPLLLDEPVPRGGRLRVPDRPGFGVSLNRDLKLSRPYTH
ncbi:L-rhamnonate dehydratase [Micromonospora sp. CPCC 206061]|uniref:L-rhamnonate dehydratase n=1 Tax=Micromonospora sp. CPCC 206061 TaxID=3122410 RepID=UPI002FF06180